MNLSIFCMCLTTCKSLNIQWICKLFGKNWKPIITQHQTRSPKTSVSFSKIPGNSTQTQNRRFTAKLFDSRSCLKNISLIFWIPMKLRRQQMDVSRNFLLNSPFVNLQSQCFVDNSGNLHSKPTNSKTAKVVEFSKEAIKIVSSRANKRQQVRNPIPS